MKRVLISPDLHFPFMDRSAVDVMLKYISDQKWDAWVDLGDRLDFDFISKHSAEYPRLWLGKKFDTIYKDAGKELDRWLQAVRAKNKKCEAIYIEGNHEYRVQRYIDQHPELEGSVEVPLGMELEKKGVKWVPFWSEGRSHRIGKCTFIHGIWTNMHHARKHVMAFMTSVVYGHCVSSDTEVLGRDGWISYTSIKEGETEVLTFNIVSKKMEWNVVRSLYLHDYQNLLHLKSEYSDVLATPYHGMIGYTSRKTAVEFFPISTFTDKCQRILIHGGVEDRDDFPLTDDQIRLVVWICADAHLKEDGYVVWGMKKRRKISRLLSILKNLEITPCVKDRSRETWISFNVKKACLRVFMLFDKIKELPSCMKDLSARQAGILFKEYGVTDGHTRGTSIRCYSSKPEEINLIQSLAVRSGFKSIQGVQHNELANPTCKPLYTLSINPNPYTNIQRAYRQLEKVNYDGKVWCVCVDNGTIVTRRNGRVTVTQNTHDYQAYSLVKQSKKHPIEGTSLGCLCAPQPWMRGKPNNWQLMFGVFYFEDNGFFQKFPVKIFNGQFRSPEGRYYK